METTGSPHGRRCATFAALLGVFISVGGVGSRHLCRAQGVCSGLLPPPIPITDPNYTKGFPRDAEIPYFIDVSASPVEESQIVAAFTFWEAELGAAGKHFAFIKTNDQPLARAHGIDVVIG